MPEILFNKYIMTKHPVIPVAAIGMIIADLSEKNKNNNILNNNTVGLRICVVNILYFNNLNPWVAWAATWVIALKGMVNM